MFLKWLYKEEYVSNRNTSTVNVAINQRHCFSASNLKNTIGCEDVISEFQFPRCNRNASEMQMEAAIVLSKITNASTQGIASFCNYFWLNFIILCRRAFISPVVSFQRKLIYFPYFGDSRSVGVFYHPPEWLSQDSTRLLLVTSCYYQIWIFWLVTRYNQRYCIGSEEQKNVIVWKTEIEIRTLMFVGMKDINANSGRCSYSWKTVNWFSATAALPASTLSIHKLRCRFCSAL
jgi:hypothetical protein